MKRNIPVLLFTATVLMAVLAGPAPSGAVDREGCLTCHRYPGLVQSEGPDRIKILHIDEEQHLKSAHGSVDCRECHTDVVKMPHTGKTDVDCTTRCHLDEKQKIEASLQTSRHDYHRGEKFFITRLEDGSSCRACHPLYPHSKSSKMRALINMHTGFMVCEVCHLKNDASLMLSYEWNPPEPFEFTGQPYGTHAKSEPPQQAKASLISKMLRIFSSRDASGQDGAASAYVISRIAVFGTVDGRKAMLTDTTDTGKAGEYLKKADRLSPEQQEKQLGYFHRNIARKEISVACDECHSPGGMLDFVRLGFNEKRAKDLEYLNIKSLVTKYETFYIPNLFGH